MTVQSDIERNLLERVNPLLQGQTISTVAHVATILLVHCILSKTGSKEDALTLLGLLHTSLKEDIAANYELLKHNMMPPTEH